MAVESMSSKAQTGYSGATIVYALPIRNTGTVTDSYTLVVSTNGWPTTAPAAVGPLAPSATLTVPVTVQIPAQALAFANDVATLQLTSQGDVNQEAMSRLTTTANPVSAVSATVAVNGQAGTPATTVVYQVEVTNVGNITDTFMLSFGGHQWPTTLPTTMVGPLAPGASSTLTVAVTIPAGTTANANDTVVVTITVQRDPTKSTTVSLTTTAQSCAGSHLSALPARFNQKWRVVSGE